MASYAPKYALIYGVPQGSIIDRIDYNMEKTAEQTAAGKEELTKAERSHRRSPAMSVLFFSPSFFPLFFWPWICRAHSPAGGAIGAHQPCVLTLNHSRSLATSPAPGVALVCIGSVEGTRDMRKNNRSQRRLTKGECVVRSSKHAPVCCRGSVKRGWHPPSPPLFTATNELLNLLPCSKVALVDKCFCA